MKLVHSSSQMRSCDKISETGKKKTKLVKLVNQCGGQMRTSDKMESAGQPEPNYN